MGRAYTLYGPPPTPASRSFYGWKEGLRNWRTAFCPLTQSGSTFYYSWSTGNDSTGTGTILLPWKTITKLNAQAVANTTHLLLGGDVWNDGVGIVINTNNVSVGAYFPAPSNNPIINNFTLQYTSGWTQVGGTNHWTRAETHTIAWVRKALDLLAPLELMTTGQSTGVLNTPLSWWWDSVGQVLHLNPGVGVNPNSGTYEAVVDAGSSSVAGIAITGNADGSLVQNIRLDGFGATLTYNPGGQGVSVAMTGGTYNEVVLDTVECYYTGYRGFAQVSNTGGEDVVTFANCKAGYPVPSAGGSESLHALVLAALSENITYNFTSRWGTLRADNWYPSGTTIRGATLTGSSKVSTTAAMVIYDKHTIINPTNGLGCAAVADFANAGLPAAVLITDLRGFIIDERAQGGQPLTVTANQNYARINGIYELNPVGAGTVISSNVDGWMWNTTFVCTANLLLAGSGPHTLQIWNSAIVFTNGGGAGRILDSSKTPASAAPTMKLVNSVFGCVGTFSSTGVNLTNDSTHLIGNAYFQVTSSGSQGYSGDAHLITLSTLPPENYLPTPGTPLYNAGMPIPGGVFLQYDQNWKSRPPGGGSTGPLESPLLGPSGPTIYDRVRETTQTPGTGTVTLQGAVLGYQSFSVVGNGSPTYYTIADQIGPLWEVGVGNWNVGGFLTRTAANVRDGFNGPGVLVNFHSNVKDVFLYPDAQLFNLI